jgi:hypothetical protein
MAQSFKIMSGKKTFGQITEPGDASDYITKKRTQATYCVPNSCSPSFKVSSQSEMLMLRASTQATIYPCLNSVDNAQLYINLITELDLSSNVIPIIDTTASSPGYPAAINPTSTAYTRYLIDPSGNLFGNTTCGLSNYLNYLVYNPPPTQP